MAVNKVEYFGRVLIDLTADTVSTRHLAAGITAHDASGNLITGTLEQGSLESFDVNDIIDYLEGLGYVVSSPIEVVDTTMLQDNSNEVVYTAEENQNTTYKINSPTSSVEGTTLKLQR